MLCGVSGFGGGDDMVTVAADVCFSGGVGAGLHHSVAIIQWIYFDGTKSRRERCGNRFMKERKKAAATDVQEPSIWA